MATPKRKRTKPTPAALPPIPTDTPEGARALAIRDVIDAVDTPLPGCQYGLQLEDEAVVELAKRLGVPALHIISSLNVDHNTHVEDIEAYVAWRRQLAGEGVK